VSLAAFALALVFAATLFASIYTYVRNEEAIADLEQAMQFASPRSRVMRAEMTNLTARRPYYYAAIAASIAGIGGALAYGTLRRRA
jgi:hypothetical protein